MLPYSRAFRWLILALLVISLAGCKMPGPGPVVSSPAASVTPGATAEITPAQTAPSATPAAPSPTPEPQAALVNGEPLSLAEYQSEVGRFQASKGSDATPEEMRQVLDEMVNNALLAQGAAEAGFTLDDAALQSRIDQLAAKMGGAEALAKWQQANGYTDAGFRHDLARSIAAAWMRDKLAAEVPEAAEQIHARQVLYNNVDSANAALAQLQAGKDFATLAAEEDPVTEGDLGWFPRGYLPDSNLEEAAFSLQPGQYSAVIQTPAGFHILQVIERDPQRALEAAARLALQVQAVKSWLEQRRSQSDIQVLLP